MKTKCCGCDLPVALSGDRYDATSMNSTTYQEPAMSNFDPRDVPEVGDRVVVVSGEAPQRLLQRPAIVLTQATAITPGGLRPYTTLQFTHNDEILMVPTADLELAPVIRAAHPPCDNPLNCSICRAQSNLSTDTTLADIESNLVQKWNDFMEDK